MDKPDLKIHKLNSKAEQPVSPRTDDAGQEQPVRYVAVPEYAVSPYLEDDTIDLLALWRILIEYKHVLAAVFLLGMILASGYAFLTTPMYRAELVMAPVTKDKGGALSSLSGQFGGLASLAGVNLPSGDNDVDKVLATLKSRAFLTPFFEQEKIPQYFAESKPNGVLSSQEIYEEFTESVLTVSKNNKTGLVTLAVEWTEPTLAAKWANDIVAQLNEHQRQSAIDEAQQSIDYLNQQLNKTSVVDMQQAIYRLIESQTKVIMLANVKKEYAMQIIDPAMPPEKHVRPQRALILILGALLSVFVGVFVVFLLHGFKDMKQRLLREE